MNQIPSKGTKKKETLEWKEKMREPRHSDTQEDKLKSILKGAMPNSGWFIQSDEDWS